MAYIVPRESAPATSELRAYLKAKLPDYMVPGAIVVLDAHSFNRQTVKSIAKRCRSRIEHSADSSVYVGPRNSIEESIAGIWAEILGVKPIGVHDNFFDLGGHSLKATQVVSRLRKVFQSEIPLRHLFEFPTVAELAAVIDSKTIDGLNSEKLDRLLSEIEAMSEEEAQKLLAQKTAARGRD